MILVIALSFVKFCEYENSFHALVIKSHVHTTISPFSMILLWKLALYHPYIHRYKCSIVCIDFSLLKYLVKEVWLLKKGT
jgi:hypothetical protein